MYKEHTNTIEQMDKNFYSYLEGRKCDFCDSAIADQEHGARTFCERQVLPDGSIKSCKDDYWAAVRKNESDIYKKIERYHKEVSARLKYLFDLNLPEITHEILDNTGIHLNRCLCRHQEKNNLMIFYFVGYAVSIHPITNHIKIFNHDEELF